jgi:hypothetical protein
VWRVSGAAGLSVALNNLLQEPLERRSRGHAAAQVGWLGVGCGDGVVDVPVCAGGKVWECAGVGCAERRVDVL